MKNLPALGILAGCLSTSCATQLSTKHLNATAATTTISDFTYYLPRQQINVTLTYALQNCKKSQVGSTPATGVKIKKTAKIALINERDPSSRFAIIPEHLEDRNKTTELKLETYDNGTIKSLGLTVDDRTAEIAKSAIESGTKIAEIAISGAASGYDCTQAISTLVDTRNQLINDLRDPTKYAGKDERAAAIDALSRMNGALTITRKFSFTPDPIASVAGDRVSKLHIDNGLLTGFESRWLKSLPATGTADRDKLGDLAKTALCIHAGDDGGDALGTQPTYCAKALNIAREAPYTVAGDQLAYRDPFHTTVFVCGVSCASGAGEVLTAAQHNITQFGAWRYLTVSSKGFQDRSIAAQFSVTGQRTSVTRGSSADLEAIAGVASTATEKGQAVYAKAQSSELDEINAETALLKAKADRIEQQQRLDALEEVD